MAGVLMPFILNEDKALKTLLTGITVSDFKSNNRSVGVWFGQPDVEIRNQSYPYITIELIDITEDRTRNNRGYGKLNYTPEGLDPTVDHYSELPVPVDLEYQVVSYARQPMHDRMILSSILSTKLPLRYGTLEIPEDNTLRRVELLGHRKRDTTEGGKKLYVNLFSIKVSSELFYSKIVGAAAAIEHVNIALSTVTNINVTPPA
jgi:hypothetical protein